MKYYLITYGWPYDGDWGVAQTGRGRRSDRKRHSDTGVGGRENVMDSGLIRTLVMAAENAMNGGNP